MTKTRQRERKRKRLAESLSRVIAKGPNSAKPPPDEAEKIRLENERMAAKFGPKENYTEAEWDQLFMEMDAEEEAAKDATGES